MTTASEAAAGSSAAAVEAFLADLPPERRTVVATVRDLVRRHLPAGYEERLHAGMIVWELPLARYPKTYNKQPLMYAALAAQKSAYSLYLMGAYQDAHQAERLRSAFAAAGKRIDMGKSCLRFKRIDDLALDAVGEAIASTPPDAFIAQYEAARAGR